MLEMQGVSKNFFFFFSDRISADFDQFHDRQNAAENTETDIQVRIVKPVAS